MRFATSGRLAYVPNRGTGERGTPRKPSGGRLSLAASTGFERAKATREAGRRGALYRSFVPLAVRAEGAALASDRSPTVRAAVAGPQPPAPPATEAACRLRRATGRYPGSRRRDVTRVPTSSVSPPRSRHHSDRLPFGEPGNVRDRRQPPPPGAAPRSFSPGVALRSLTLRRYFAMLISSTKQNR